MSLANDIETYLLSQKRTDIIPFMRASSRQLITFGETHYRHDDWKARLIATLIGGPGAHRFHASERFEDDPVTAAAIETYVYRRIDTPLTPSLQKFRRSWTLRAALSAALQASS
jgi:hypothetical protein